MYRVTSARPRGSGMPPPISPASTVSASPGHCLLDVQTGGWSEQASAQAFCPSPAGSGWPKAGLAKSCSCTSCAFIPISLRPSPPLAKGGLGGVVPARPVTRSSHALSLSVLSHPSREARRIVLDFQGSRITPPAPPSQGGERDRSRRHSIPRNRNTCLEIAPPALSTLTFHRPSRPLLCLTHFDHGVIECSIEDRRLRHAVYRPDEPGEYGRSTENRNSSRIPPSENPQRRRHPECDRRRPGREPRAHP